MAYDTIRLLIKETDPSSIGYGLYYCLYVECRNAPMVLHYLSTHPEEYAKFKEYALKYYTIRIGDKQFKIKVISQRDPGSKPNPDNMMSADKPGWISDDRKYFIFENGQWYTYLSGVNAGRRLYIIFTAAEFEDYISTMGYGKQRKVPRALIGRNENHLKIKALPPGTLAIGTDANYYEPTNTTMVVKVSQDGELECMFEEFAGFDGPLYDYLETSKRFWFFDTQFEFTYYWLPGDESFDVSNPLGREPKPHENRRSSTDDEDNGYNDDGYDEGGYNEGGYNEDGYDIDGYNIDGFNADGIDQYGFDTYGYNADGYDEDGRHRDDDDDDDLAVAGEASGKFFDDLKDLWNNSGVGRLMAGKPAADDTLSNPEEPEEHVLDYGDIMHLMKQLALYSDDYARSLEEIKALPPEQRKEFIVLMHKMQFRTVAEFITWWEG